MATTKKASKKAEPKPKAKKLVEMAAAPQEQVQPQAEQLPQEAVAESEAPQEQVEKGVAAEAANHEDGLAVEEVDKIPDWVMESNNAAPYKALVGNSRIWGTQLVAAQNKYFERYFFAPEGQELGLGATIFTDAELTKPFNGMDGFITISVSEGEQNLTWAVCQVTTAGVISGFYLL